MTARSCRLAALAAACAAISACFSYVPLRVAAPQPGRGLRVDLMQPVEFTMPQLTYRGIVRAQGRLLYIDADSVVLAASRVWSSSGESYLGEGAGIVIPSSHISQLSGQRLSAGKTVLAVGVGGAAIGVVLFAVGPLAGFGGEQKPKPQP